MANEIDIQNEQDEDEDDDVVEDEDEEEIIQTEVQQQQQQTTTTNESQNNLGADACIELDDDEDTLMNAAASATQPFYQTGLTCYHQRSALLKSILHFFKKSNC